MSVALYTTNPWFVLAFGFIAGVFVASVAEPVVRWGRAKWRVS